MSLNSGFYHPAKRSRRPLGTRLALVLVGAALGVGGSYGYNYAKSHHLGPWAQSTSQAQQVAGTLPQFHSVAPAGPKAHIGVPFTNFGFKITVLRVAMHQKALPQTADDKSVGIKPTRPQNGQFILVYVKATNIGNKPNSMATDASTLVDTAGKRYEITNMYLIQNGDGLGDDQAPGSTRTGWIAFDVPPAVTAVATIIVQPDDYVATTNPPTEVALR